MIWMEFMCPVHTLEHGDKVHRLLSSCRLWSCGPMESLSWRIAGREHHNIKLGRLVFHHSTEFADNLSSADVHVMLYT